MTAATAERQAARANSAKMVAAAAIGNALEWFDILVYGYLAVTLAKLFFPAGDEVSSLLLSLGTFASSYFMRPLGAIVLGAYADRAGRKAAMTLSILLMTIGTLLMAVMPVYATIGIAADYPSLLAASSTMLTSAYLFTSISSLRKPTCFCNCRLLCNAARLGMPFGSRN